MVIDNANNHKIEYGALLKVILNPDGFKNCTIGLKVMAVFLDQANKLIPQDISLVKPAYCK